MQVSRSGLDGILVRAMTETQSFLLDNVTDVHLNNTRLAYLFRVRIVSSWDVLLTEWRVLVHADRHAHTRHGTAQHITGA